MFGRELFPPFSVCFGDFFVVHWGVDPFLFANAFQDAFNSAIGKCLHFFVGAILDGVGDEDASGIKSQGGGLGIGCFSERLGCDKDSGYAARFQVGRVVHTARCAGPSIRQAFDDDIALGGDLLLEFDGCRARECGFDVAVDFEVALREMRFDAVEEYVAPAFGYVEKPDGQSVE